MPVLRSSSFKNVMPEDWSRQFISRVAPRPLKVFEDVGQSRDADLQLGRKPFHTNGARPAIRSQCGSKFPRANLFG